MKRNTAKCLACGDVLESLTVHDFRTCQCGNLSVDGGPYYTRRLWRGGDDSWQELSTGFEDAA